MAERRNHERRKWGRKVTYPFIDSDGVLVTKNRRRLVDRRVAKANVEEEATKSASKTMPPTLSDAQEPLDISESKIMELDEALKDDKKEEKPATGIDASIKDLESQILTQTEKVAKIDIEKSNDDKSSTDTKTATPKPVTDTSPSDKQSSNDASIEISFKGDKHILSDDNKTFKVGRDPACDIIVQGKYVSRAHAKIICKDGKFLLKDESFNGTYIKFNNGQKVHVTKNEQTLVTDGVMSMGEPVKDHKKSIIQFKILE